MATALQFAARKICSRALERPAQRLFSAAASAVVKEEQRMLLPRISHGGSPLRRFSSSEAPNLLNNNKHLPCEAKSGLAKRIEAAEHNLRDLLRQREGEYSVVAQQEDLPQLLKRSNIRVLTTCCNITAAAMFGGTVAAGAFIVVCEFVFGPKKNNRESNTSPGFKYLSQT